MSYRVLIADDIDYVRQTLKEILVRNKYQVIGEAKNGNDAIEVYRQNKPDLVFMDIVMPEASGIEATRRIVKMDKEARIVVISAMTQENIIMEAIAAGARDYLLKPFTEDDIIKCAGHLLAAVESKRKKAAGGAASA